MKVSLVRSGQCVGIIILCLIACATLFIPFTIIDGQVTFSYTLLPFLKLSENPLSIDYFSLINQSVFTLINFNLSEQIISLLNLCSLYGIYAFYGILGVNIIFAILCLITQCNLIRKIARIFSIIFGILMIFLTILFLIDMVGSVIYYINLNGGFNFALLPKLVIETGFLFFIGLNIFAFKLTGKQFKWFTKKDIDD